MFSHNVDLVIINLRLTLTKYSGALLSVGFVLVLIKRNVLLEASAWYTASCSPVNKFFKAIKL